MKAADQLQVGETFEPYTFRVTPEFNQVFRTAQNDADPRYERIIHPALLFNQSNATRSPSFYLPKGMAAIHATEVARFIRLGLVGERISVSWTVVSTFEKRGKVFQTREALITGDDNSPILCRRITDAYIRQEDRRTETDQSKHLGNTTQQPILSGDPKQVTTDRMALFSGGFPHGEGWPKKNIHTDMESAKGCGLPAPIASGAMSIGYIVELLLCTHGVQCLFGNILDLKFVAAVFAGDVVQARLRGTDVWCENQYGVATVVGIHRLRESA